MEHDEPPESQTAGTSALPVPDGGPEPGAPTPPAFDPHDELIGDMEWKPRHMREQEMREREARARRRKEKWDHRMRWFRRREHAA